MRVVDRPKSSHPRRPNIRGRWKMKLAKTAVLAALTASGASVQTNLGAHTPEASLPFVMTKVATFNLPWRLGFLPDGRMVITEKVGPIWLVTQTGEKTPVANVPPVLPQGQGGMLGVFLRPTTRRTTSPTSPMPSPA